jgi:hypothetical protein
MQIQTFKTAIEVLLYSHSFISTLLLTVCFYFICSLLLRVDDVVQATRKGTPAGAGPSSSVLAQV